MTTADFWQSIQAVIADGFTSGGLTKLEEYAELLITNRLVYKRFSPREQHGCAAGGSAHVIASLLAGAEAATSGNAPSISSDFKGEQQRGEAQALVIEKWARKTGCWFDNVDETLTAQLGEKIAEGGEAQVYDHGATLIKTIGLDYYIQPLLALARITLHNAWFPETRLTVLGFGRKTDGSFVIIAEQPYIQGSAMTDAEISAFALSLGFELKNPRNRLSPLPTSTSATSTTRTSSAPPKATSSSSTATSASTPRNCGKAERGKSVMRWKKISKANSLNSYESEGFDKMAESFLAK